MAEPWLGGYQNVNASDAYLTPHQREALQHFRAEQGTGFRFQVRQHWERLSGKEKGDDTKDGLGGPYREETKGSGGSCISNGRPLIDQWVVAGKVIRT